MVPEKLVRHLCRATTTQRWHDHIRPCDLTVQGKHAHMMTIAWVLGRVQEDGLFGANRLSEDQRPAFWMFIIERGLFELLRKCEVYDLKSQIWQRIMSNEKAQRQLNGETLRALTRTLEGDLPTLANRLSARQEKPRDGGPEGLAWQVLRAASCVATCWEYTMLEPSNAFLSDVTGPRYNLENEKCQFQFLEGFRDIDDPTKGLARFVELCGRLRLQERWSQTPIIPKRPVLDHSLMVANLTYLSGLARGFSDGRIVNNYFAALFHDFVEAMTRDIVNPIKRREQLKGVNKIAVQYGEEEFERQLRPMVPSTWRKDLHFFAVDEFKTRTRQSRESSDIQAVRSIDQDKADLWLTCDGLQVRAADRTAGFIEAKCSIEFGVSSPDLKEALDYAGRAKGPYDSDFKGVYRWYSNGDPSSRTTDNRKSRLGSTRGGGR
jgi:putative hydrolase of HD superfamily